LLKRGDLRIITETRKTQPPEIHRPAAEALFRSLGYGADAELARSVTGGAQLLSRAR
jgi:hypothetical protein